MRVDLFDFHLPPTAIAQTALEPRDSARLLVVPPDPAEFQDKIIRDLPAFLRAGDVLVFNNTRVIPARLFGTRGMARIEILLHRKQADGNWLAFARPGKKLRTGDRVYFAENFTATVQEKQSDGQVILHFPLPDAEFYAALDTHGHMPLPPYISRADTPADKARYQTVYAAHDGSVAAPTAGLHFTPELLETLQAAGIKTAFVTLHVGAGTFQPVKVDDTADHVMHHEYAVVTPETAASINAARATGGRVVAVGTTSLRTLESAADANGALHPMARDTGIFITPGYRFRAVDMLLTNFHLPKSTLFMLVSAFSGLEQMQNAYSHAIRSGYRFYSYGDACLLFRSEPA